MSEPIPPTAKGRPVPTHALLRAVVVGGVGALAGAILHRLDLVVIVTPLLVYAAWSVLRGRPAWARAGLAPATADMHEGESVEFRTDVPPGLVATVVVAPPEQARLDPVRGAVVTTGTGVSFEPLLWGRYDLGPALVALTDEIGAWRLLDQAAPVRIRVRPASSRLVGASGITHPTGIAGVHRSGERGSGTELADVREFVPGDRLRRVNWKVSSRTGRLHVTETFQERDTDVLIVVDSLSVIAGAPRPDGEAGSSSLDATVRAIAAVALHYVGFGDRVGVHDLGTAIGPIRSGTGPRQIRIVVDRLSQVRRDVRPVRRVNPVHSLVPGTLVFVCSPLLEPSVVDELVRLRRLGGEVVVVDTLPEELGRSRLPGRDADRLAEGWAMRRIGHDTTVLQLRGAGIPVTPWQGPGSLAGILLAMEHARSAPRMRGHR